MKKNIFNIIVPPNYHGYRIDKFLQSQIIELSRTRLQTLIRDGQVKLNNIIINNTSKKIKEADQIRVEFLPAKENINKHNKIYLYILVRKTSHFFSVIYLGKVPGLADGQY